MSQEVERELGWEDEIEKEGGNFVLLPPGDYNFTVAKFDRGRFPGSEKMPPCNQAKLELTIHSPQHGDITIFHNLMLHTKTEGFLSNFFMGIGQKKPGEKLRMNWNAVVRAKGRCKIIQNKYMSKGEERVNNQVETFYPYEDYLKHVGSNQQQYQQPPQQQTYQQQTPFPTGQPQQGGFTPGQF
ncbi:hypothetical protein AWH56_005355 [Anaerobacillus isosaccharinicus]|uniref:DUF669 domain-containing protein n=1 Tax=Anaerobacillus isosaccharinicus TaxID=1532552 RepID=A0A1S2L983_9BACI|nr:hypothetical protein [Anaerobacillus isosaccharinicus]MBA5584547.1 hypothetical protein [Anaerobacillus isosaccharinicus]QOY37069.1 hypothetical protein AWH56_005355 [Anaerobacillus isosaccharinicus]